MKRLKEINQLKKTENQLEKQLLSPQYVDLNKMFQDFEAYLVTEADMKAGIVLGTGQRRYEAKEGELAIEISKKESNKDNLLIRIILPGSIAHDTIIEVVPTLVLSKEMAFPDLPVEITEKKKRVQELQNLATTKPTLGFRIVSMNVPQKANGGQVPVDTAKTFLSLKEVMTYAEVLI